MTEKTLDDVYTQLEYIKSQLAKIVLALGQGTES
jgi:CO dehydrogenase/acetyl-CoA synthase alpha subunit